MREVFRNRLTYAAILLPSLITLLFLTVFLPAIDGADQRMKGMRLDIVNEGGAATAPLAQQLAAHVPLSAVMTTKEEALRDVEHDTAQMVVLIPASFASDAQRGRAQLTFIRNGAAPSSTQSLLETVESKLVNAVNDAVYAEAQNRIKQALQASAGSTASSTHAGAPHPSFPVLPRTPVLAQTTYVHQANGRTASFMPFLLLITSFIGSMALSALSFRAVASARQSGRVISTLGAQVGINVAASAIAALVWLGLLNMVDVAPTLSFGESWVYIGLAEFLMICVIQLFVYLLGLPGLALGLLLFPLQLVTSGVLVPKQLLPSVYSDVAGCLPGPYLMELATRVYNGSPLSDHFAWAALAFFLVALAAMVCRTFWDAAKQRRKVLQT